MKNKLKKIIAAVVVIVVAAGGVFYYRQTNAVSAGAGSIMVEAPTEQAARGDITEIVSASGTVAAAEENGVYIETTQKVSAVNVKLGDIVEVGDILVEYDVDYSKKELENTLKQNQISLKNSQLSLQSLTAAPTESELLTLNSNIASAEKNLLDARNNLTSTQTQITQLETALINAEKSEANYKALLAVGGASQEEYDNAVEAVDDAKTALEEAKTSIPSLEMAISNAEASLNQANINYKLALDPLSDENSQINYQKQQNEISKAQLTIENVQDKISDLIEYSTAHVSGTVISVGVEDGSVVTEDTEILKIADLNNLIVTAYISEYDVPLLNLGQNVTITTDAIANTVYTGKVSYISPIASVTSTFSGSETTVEVEVSIDNPDGVLKPGYSVDMEIAVTDVQDAVTVSLSAVALDPKENSHYVFTISPERNLEKTYVEIGATDDLIVEITSGLSEGDTVVSSPTEAMAEGTPLSDYTTTMTMPEASGNTGATQNGGINIGVGGMTGGGGGGMAPAGGGMAPSGGARSNGSGSRP